MKHQDIIEKMTVEEKAAFLSGKGEWATRDIPRLNIPSVYCTDGPHGIRKQAGAGDHLGLNESLPATCFPTAGNLSDGIVITDWGGSNDHVKGVQARSNLEMPMPGLDSARQILAAVIGDFAVEPRYQGAGSSMVKPTIILDSEKFSIKK